MSKKTEIKLIGHVVSVDITTVAFVVAMSCKLVYDCYTGDKLAVGDDLLAIFGALGLRGASARKVGAVSPAIVSESGIVRVPFGSYDISEDNGCIVLAPHNG